MTTTEVLLILQGIILRRRVNKEIGLSGELLSQCAIRALAYSGFQNDYTQAG